MDLLRRIARLASALLLLVAGPACADPADIAAASRGVVRVVLIQYDGGTARLVSHGTGFAIAPDLVVTNAHVVEDLRTGDGIVAGVVPSEGRGAFAATIAAYSPGRDLALLKLRPGATISALTLFSGAATDSEEVYAVGYPGNVDMAEGLSMSDLVSPQAAVKTRGYVSAGRSSKEFDTILHTAPIGAGNSGGPLLDACGRVLGVNSFGTVSQNTTDSAFYFAISMRELAAFLQEAGVSAHASGLPCTSLADLDKADAARSAEDQARLAAEAEARKAAQSAFAAKAQHDAELEILGERDNALALAAVLLVAAVAAGAAAYAFLQRGKQRELRIAGGAAGLLVLAAVGTWLLRPPLSLIDERAKDIVAEGKAKAEARTEAAPAADASAAPADAPQKLVCVLDTARSRVTVSDVTDVPLTWAPGGCVNGRTQYGLAGDGWSRVLVPQGEATISVTKFDPDKREYTVERFLMGLDAMTAARAARTRLTPPACGAGDAAARALGEAQGAIRALLPAEPNERLRYTCHPAP
ncbi:peptidase S1 [Novosphingobium fuchskuhlense]|uniref:Peptidase S1 n=1 Tax=Novosphingobium fuchskuhlense TaxID=1117702 RepID=A0A117UT93_9SPHN|nr:serine protease [Novosphingobium fuchskuhlense]KUR70434.1 peptidase S1 [Novosphingobium fuchskuhlense]